MHCTTGSRCSLPSQLRADRRLGDDVGDHLAQIAHDAFLVDELAERADLHGRPCYDVGWAARHEGFKVVTKSVTLPIGRGGSVRLAAVADTHSPAARGDRRSASPRSRPTRSCTRGDIGDLAVLEELAEIAPVLRGARQHRHARARPARRADDRASAPLRILHDAHRGVRAEAPRRGRAAWRAPSRRALVVCGHSHVPFIGDRPAASPSSTRARSGRGGFTCRSCSADRYHADRRQARARQLRDRRGVEPP